MNISITWGSLSGSSANRDEKGHSLLAFPDDYCVVDIETTGLSAKWDSIIEIGAIRYSGEKEISRFQTLVQPPILIYEDDDNEGKYVTDFIEELTGITNEMLETAPCTKDAVTAFSEFLGSSIILGYNVNFDVNFLYDAYVKYLDQPLSNDFVDIMRMAKRLLPDLPHHRLKDILAYFELVNNKEHRTLTDCEATQNCYIKLHEMALAQYGDERSFFESWQKRKKRYGKYQYIKASDIRGDETKFNPDCPLYQRHCVITGTLEKYSRTDALQIIADLGGILENSVTKKTNYLILGNNDYNPLVKDGKSSKHKKAEDYKLKGQDIEIIPESTFYDMIADFMLDLTGGSI